MTTSNDGRMRLAAAVKAARLASPRGWSKERAAREAAINVVTWDRVEQGMAVRDDKLAAVEQALGWDAGTALALLEQPEESPQWREVETSVPALRILAAGWSELSDQQQRTMQDMMLTMFDALRSSNRDR